MNKKIVVIKESLRRNGNSFVMTEAFIQAAKNRGHSITRFDAFMKKADGCLRIQRVEVLVLGLFCFEKCDMVIRSGKIYRYMVE